MGKRFKAIGAGMLLAMVVQEIPAADIEHGRKLYIEQCLRCHGSEVYTREDRRVQSLDGLKNQVAMCALQLDAAWFDEDVEDVVLYLNELYYHFPK